MHKQIKPFAEAQNCIGLQMHLVQEAWQIFADFKETFGNSMLCKLE
jgi:hypothetical protein